MIGDSRMAIRTNGPAQARRRIELTFDTPPPTDALRGVAGVRECTVSGSTAHLEVEGSTAELLAVAAPHRVSSVVTHEPDLEQIFMDYYGADGV